MQLNKYIDHTLLKADATPDQVKKICAEAREYGFKSVCVNSCYAKLVSTELADSNVLTCCVVGFPLGAMMTEAKANEALCAANAGAQEIDMVINIGMAKAGAWDFVESDIRAVVEAVQTMRSAGLANARLRRVLTLLRPLPDSPRVEQPQKILHSCELR